MVGAVQAFNLASARVPVSAGTKEHVIEHAKSEAHTIDGHRRHAYLLVEKAGGEFVPSVPRVQVAADDERTIGQRGSHGSHLRVAQPRSPERTQPPGSAERIEMNDGDRDRRGFRDDDDAPLAFAGQLDGNRFRQRKRREYGVAAIFRRARGSSSVIPAPSVSETADPPFSGSASRSTTIARRTGSAAVTYFDGHLVFRYQSGEVALIEASPAGMHLKGVFKADFVQSPSWAHPVVAGGRLYLREQDKLMCYDLQ